MSGQTDQQDHLWGGAEALLVRLKARGHAPLNTAHLHDPDFDARFMARSGVVVGYDDDSDRPSMPPPQKPVRDPNVPFTAAEAAAQLSITVEQLMAHVGDGALQPINVGRGKKRPRYRFEPTDIEKFKAERRTLEKASCPSSFRKSLHPTTGTASKSNVVGFTALRAAHLARKPSGSKR